MPRSALPAPEVEATRAVITHVEGIITRSWSILLEDVAPFELAPLSTGIVLDRGWRTTGCGIVERAGEPILAIDLRALVPGLTAIAA